VFACVHVRVCRCDVQEVTAMIKAWPGPWVTLLVPPATGSKGRQGKASKVKAAGGLSYEEYMRLTSRGGGGAAGASAEAAAGDGPLSGDGKGNSEELDHDVAMADTDDAVGTCNSPATLGSSEGGAVSADVGGETADKGSASRRSTRGAKAAAEPKAQAPPSRKANESAGDVLFVYPLKNLDGRQRTRGADTVTVTRGDLNTLADEELLNDTVMDFYIKYLEANLSVEEREQCHFFSTFFWKRLSQEQNPEARHKGVERWTNKVDLFEKRFLFVPICDSLHWTLAILCRPAGITELDEFDGLEDVSTVGEQWGSKRKDLHITLYLDSLGGRNLCARGMLVLNVRVCCGWRGE